MRLRQIELFEGEEITDDILATAAELYSSQYGVWSEGCEIATPGSRIHLSPSRLNAQCFPTSTGDRTKALARVKVDGNVVGHACAARWQFQGRQLCWITQLVVHEAYRNQKLATTLLLNLAADDDEIFGTLSVNPFALKAMSRACGSDLFPRVPLEFVRKYAEEVLASSPITNVRNAKPAGTIFNFKTGGSLRCGARTGFAIDQTEAANVVKELEAKDDWPLGELKSQHEYLLLIDGKSRGKTAVFM